MTVALATAEILSRMRGEIAGSVKFVFQPDEEGAPEGEDSGAVRMIREGTLGNPREQAIFALHSNPTWKRAQSGTRPARCWHRPIR